uniref:C-type lectin domain-containing protein n=1 Tax=Acrobeloides nanus TaxID=290746 RepID=A0A914EBI2_9BILA
MDKGNREGPYSWADGSPCCNYTNWCPQKSGLYKPDCNLFYKSTGQWNDHHCAYTSPFICKKDSLNKGNNNEDKSGDQNDSAHTNPIGDWRKECGLSDEGKWKSSGSSSTTSAPGTGLTIAPGIPTLPPQTCSIFCPTRPGSTTPFKGDNLVNGLNLMLANLPKEEAPVDTVSLPRTLKEPTRVKRQGIQLLGLEGLIKNVLMLVRQLLNDLLPGLQKLLKDIGPDLLNLLDKLLGSLKELLDKVLTGLINALGGNSNLLSALSGGLSLLGALG